MALNKPPYLQRSEYEYLCRWSCECRQAYTCEECEDKGYSEEWLPLEIALTLRPVTILAYRLAGVPSPSRQSPSNPDAEIVRDAEMDPA